MIIERLLAGAAAAALLAGAASAQTGGSTSMTPSATGTGAMQAPSTAARPYAAPPTVGGAATPSAAAPSGAYGAAPAMGATSASAPFRSITPVPGADIIATLKASGEFTTLLSAFGATNLTNFIATHPDLTLFAPTDAAFAALPPGQLDQLMKAPTQLQPILAYHLIGTIIKESDVKGHSAGQVETAAKKKVTIDGSGSTIKVNDATVLQPGVTATNGIIYPIDKVLTPPAA